MSYIINNTDAYINSKLTELGRQKLAKGTLNFSFWAIGDSEINYDREIILDANPTDITLSAQTKILRPKDRQPDIKSWITTGGTNPLQVMTASNIKTLKVVVNNEATERGFFSGDSISGFTTYTGSPYTIYTGFITDATISGGTTLVIGTGATRSVGDLILIKMSNSTLGAIANNSNIEPVPHLWYKVQATSATTITVDRELPNLGGTGGTSIQYIIYTGGEVHNTIGSGCTTSYWDSGTLSFDSACDISCGDVPVWNMNNVWCETLAGITATTYEGHEYFGSYPYLGQKNPFFEYPCATLTDPDTSLRCAGLSELDGVNKSIAIIHYTNNSISNFYGEFFHIDNANNKTLKLHLPDLMYHRREFTGGTETGDIMGMTFIASGETQFIGTSNLEYIDLIEDPTMVTTPIVVGKVFPQLKVVVIDDEEIVAALSYKSNRNWTLPPLAATLANPSGGTSTGLLIQNETMYVTYALENSTGTGLTTSLACQKYAKITNQTSVAKDVQFRIEGTGLFPYMRKIEKMGYDGRGFHAYELKVLYQIVANEDDRPDPTAWKVYDYTTSGLTTSVGESINPLQLENQSPVTNGFVIDMIKDSGTTTYDITQSLSMAALADPQVLQFGDERFFYGNLETYIGATIFKTIFDIRINSGQFIATTNETRSTDITTNPPDIRISEVGIYDSDNDLVVIGKLSRPIKLEAGNTVMIELSMDF